METLTALLDGVEDPEATATALIENRETHGELAPALIALVYPRDLSQPVEATVSVWRRPVPATEETEDDAANDAAAGASIKDPPKSAAAPEATGDKDTDSAVTDEDGAEGDGAEGDRADEMQPWVTLELGADGQLASITIGAPDALETEDGS
jgi:hypothetical protein